MPLFRGRHVSCFYCGQRDEPPPSTVYHPNNRVRYFSCRFCNADNHYDENGEVIDYVPDSPPPAPRYARRRSSPPSFSRITRPAVDPTPPPSRLFCRTCENNQIIVNNAIAQYDFYSEDDPRYDDQIRRQFPLYKQQLEERYPQVCANCAPKVNAHIKRTNYQVKASSLGHMLQRSSTTAKRSTNDGFELGRAFKKAVWYFRGLLWTYIHVVVLVWHGSAMLLPYEPDSFWIHGGWIACILRTISKGSLDPACSSISATQASFLLPWSFMASYWIYRERELERHPEKRLVGPREYLRLEIFTYFIRLLSWWLLAPGGVELTDIARRRVHIGFFFVALFSTLFSVTCLKLEDPPTFSLREPEPVVGTPEPTPPSSPPPMNHETLPPPRLPRYRQASPPRPTQPQPQPQPQSFQPQQRFAPSLRADSRPMSSFTPKKPTINHSISHDSDAMDWNPTIPSPAKNSSIWQARDPSSPSPFVGTLPAAPKPPAHQLVSSMLPQPALRQQEPTPVNYFANRNTQQPVPSTKTQKFAPFAPPKFQVDSDTTGLEGLLGPSLTLNDPPEMPVALEKEREKWDAVGVRISLLTVAVGIWSFLDKEEGLRVLPPLLLVIEAAWMGYLKDGIAQLFAAVLGGLAFVTAIAVSTEGYSVLAGQATGILLFITGIWETWGVMMKLQRMRKSEFWKEETSRAIAQEKRENAARRRNRVSPAPATGGLAGLRL